MLEEYPPVSPDTSDGGPAFGWRFGDFEFRSQPFRLSRKDEPVALQPQPARALALLLARAGEVVRREELRDHLWGPEIHLDHEQAINFTIRKVRQALGDDAAVPRYIETLPRLGYRFVAPVERVETPAAPHHEETMAGPEAGTSRSGWTARRWAIGAGLAAAVLTISILAAARFDYLGSPDETSPPSATAGQTAISKLAVLPFGAAGVEETETALAAVMTEELITQFARRFAPRLGVIALSSAQVYEKSEQSVEEIGSKLGADYLVRGNVTGRGERLRITVRLWRVDDQVHLWGEAFETDVAALPAWYEEVTRSLGDALGIVRHGAVKEPPPIPNSAYEAYLRGRYLIGRRDTESIELGMRSLEDALAAAPEFARAWAALAQGHYRLAWRDSFDARMENAERAALEALRHDEDQVDAHLYLGKIQLHYRFDWASAQRELEHALEASPLSAKVVHAYGLFLASLGRFDEALAHIERSVDLDPATIYASSDLAFVYYFARRYDEAITTARNHLELMPNSVPNRSLVYLSLEAQGDYEGATAEFNDAVELLGLPTLRRAESFPEVIESGLEHALGLSPVGQSRERIEIAYLYSRQGRMDLALEQLRLLCDTPVQWNTPYLAVDPRFDSLRADPRWEETLGDCLAPIERVPIQP